jgi:hypothetical protein
VKSKCHDLATAFVVMDLDQGRSATHTVTIEHCKRWDVVADLDSPCEDISYAYRGPNALEIIMHFSRVVDRANRDLVLWFKNVIALRFETESTLLDLPEPLPKCAPGDWSAQTFPLLIVHRSRWLQTYILRDPLETQGRIHYVLISLNGVCELLAICVMATWVDVDPD